MTFANKVQVFSAQSRDRYICSVTGCDAERWLKLGYARRLGSGRVVRALQLTGEAPAPRGGSRTYYEEAVPSNPHLPMLARFDERSGAFVRW